MKKFLIPFLIMLFSIPAFAQTHDAVGTTMDSQGKILYADFSAGQIPSVQKASIYDFQCIPTPTNPPAGNVRFYCNSGTGNLACLTSSGASCLSGGGGGGSGTVSNSTGAGLAYYAGSGTTVQGDTSATTNGSGTLTAVAYGTSGSNGGITGTEGTGAALTAGAGTDLLYPDSANHCWHENLNNTDVGCTASTSNTLTLTNKTIAGGSNTISALTGAMMTNNTITATQLAAQYSKIVCEGGLGDGLNVITAGTYLQSTCYNGTGVTVTLTGIKCYTDTGTSTLNSAGNTLGALQTGAVTCTNAFAAASQSANVALTSGDYIKFTFVADGTAKQTDWVVTGTY